MQKCIMISASTRERSELHIMTNNLEFARDQHLHFAVLESRGRVQRKQARERR